MFQKEALIKRYAFIGIDIIALSIALVLSNFIRFGKVDLTVFEYLYIHVYVLSILAEIFTNLVLHLDKHVFDRGFYQEFIAVMKAHIGIMGFVMAYLYATQRAIDYSRLQMFYYFLISIIVSYIGHIIAKKYISAYYKKTRSCRKVMLVTTIDKLDDILDKFQKTNNWYFELAYITVLDRDMRGQSVQNIPVVASMKDMLNVSRDIALDDVFINASYVEGFNVRWALREFQSMGIIVHVNIDALELDVSEKVIENLGYFKVVSYASRLREPSQLILKKLMDKAGAVVGLVVTALAGIFIIPAIKIESRGPAIFTQIRVGKNGRHFKMYKFRSMYSDAEERKKELEQDNEMKGAMFKVAEDPRITKVGKFIRKYSLDELPQFYNVLKGDMSLVGTRPPTVDEVEKYEITQKRRLSVTPGMTGLWQTSGRSDIYDFDEIVKLDLEYIDRWSVGLDIKLLFKTIVVCIKGKGAK